MPRELYQPNDPDIFSEQMTDIDSSDEDLPEHDHLEYSLEGEYLDLISISNLDPPIPGPRVVPVARDLHILVDGTCAFSTIGARIIQAGPFADVEIVYCWAQVHRLVDFGTLRRPPIPRNCLNTVLATDESTSQLAWLPYIAVCGNEVEFRMGGRLRLDLIIQAWRHMYGDQPFDRY